MPTGTVETRTPDSSAAKRTGLPPHGIAKRIPLLHNGVPYVTARLK
jgi:hypothetical protein